MSLHYLTVQDILWINLELTKKVNSFDFAKLEEATYYQYGYGQSTSLIPQAARFLKGFVKLNPLAAGSEQTAFVGCIAFLKVNGVQVKLLDPAAGEWLKGALSGSAEDAIRSIAVEAVSHDHSEADIRTAVREVLSGFPQTAGLTAKATG
jgi:hypothetical protein